MASDDLFRIRIPVRFPAPRVPDAEEFDAEGTAGELAGGMALFGLGLTAVAGAGWMLAGGLGAAGLAVLFLAAFLAWPERVGIGAMHANEITFGPVVKEYDETVQVFRYPGMEWTVDVDDEAAGAMDANGRTLDEIKRDVRERLAARGKSPRCIRRASHPA